MKIYDCFLFANELELLDMRLHLLSDAVDYFVICELDVDHRGRPREYVLEKHWQRFRDYGSKIIYLKGSGAPPCDESKRAYSADGRFSSGDWSIEYYHRNYIMQGLANCSGDDIILVSDADEIPAPWALGVLKGNKELERGMLAFEQRFFYYFLNLRCRENWKGTVACRYGNMVSAQSMRNMRNHAPFLADSGWHFSYMGGIQRIKEKLGTVTEGNILLAKDDYLKKCLDAGRDIYGVHNFSFLSLDEIGLPEAGRWVSKYPYLYRNGTRGAMPEERAHAAGEIERVQQHVVLFGTAQEILDLRQLIRPHEDVLQVFGEVAVDGNQAVVRGVNGHDPQKAGYVLCLSENQAENQRILSLVFPNASAKNILDGRILRFL